MTTTTAPTTEAIVLKRIPFGDSSLVVHLFCRDRGRAAILVKGAFREKGAYFGSFDLLDRVEVAILTRKSSSLGSPASARTLDNHRRLRTRLGALAAALYTAELLELALTETPQPRLFATWTEWLDWLDSPEAPSADAIALRTLAFELDLLFELGLQPTLDTCAHCAAPVAATAPEQAYAVSAGGILCAACAQRVSGVQRFSSAALGLAIALRNGETPSAESRPACEVRRFLDQFHRFYLDYSPRSRPSIEPLWH